MEEHTIFITKVSQLFIENGAKTLTMDDVAKAFGISKKTLYIKYKNKEELLEEVLEYKLHEVIARLKYLDQTIENAIERMLCRDDEIDNLSHSNNSLLIRQLMKYYPAIFEKHMIEFSDQFAEVLVHNILMGRAQGYYRENFDAEVYSKLFFQLVMSMEGSLYLDSNTINKDHYKQELMSMYMNAITTEKGKKILKNINY